VFPVKYELGLYIPEDGILHSHCRGYLNSYMAVWKIFLVTVPETEHLLWESGCLDIPFTAETRVLTCSFSPRCCFLCKGKRTIGKHKVTLGASNGDGDTVTIE
jgi:hypothetical protein